MSKKKKLIILLFLFLLLLFLSIWLYSRFEAFSYTIDAGVKPYQESLPSIDGMQRRPLAAVADPNGKLTTYVADEIILQTENQNVIDRFIRQYGGKILGKIDMDAKGVSGLPKYYLIRINTAKADIHGLEQDIAALSEKNGKKLMGKWRFSNKAAVSLMAIAASEARSSRGGIGLNFVTKSDSIPYSTQEAPDEQGGFHNAYDLYYFKGPNYKPGQLHGVTAAWGVLDKVGKLSNQVKIGILDGGFTAANADFKDWIAISNFPPSFATPDFPIFPMNAGSWMSGPDWHGTWVASAALAIPDNQYGAAGSAGPTGKPVFVFTLGDMFTTMASLDAAAIGGAKIVNMSFSTPVPWWLAWSVLPFEAFTWAYCDDILCFASAGNDRSNVDSEDACFIWCWEDKWYTPCENNGVSCVGGLNENGDWHGSSNYGDEHVDMFAPFCMWVGPDKGNPSTLWQNICGTSISSPFIAGVAALVWAADPSLSASEVWQKIDSTAHVHFDQQIDQTIKKVNALDAVIQAIRGWIGIRFRSPQNSSELPLNQVAHLAANIETIAARPQWGNFPFFTVLVTWFSDRDGELGQQQFNLPSDSVSGNLDVSLDVKLSEGMHKIKAKAMLIRISEKFVAEDNIVVNVRNFPPIVKLTQPKSGARFCQNASVAFHAIAEDRNEQLRKENLNWSSDVDGYLESGSDFITDKLTVGRHRITFKAADSGGLTSEASATIEVVANSDGYCAGNRAPIAQIIQPQNDSGFDARSKDEKGWYATVSFVGNASDQEDGVAKLKIEWFSDIEGLLGVGTKIDARLHDDGIFCGGSQQHQIIFRVTDSNGQISEDIVNLSVDGPPC